SAPFDPQATWQMPPARTTNPPPTEILSDASLPKPTAQPRQNSPVKLIAMASVAILAGALILFFVLNSQRAATSSTTQTNKPSNSLPSASEKTQNTQPSPAASTPGPAAKIPSFTGFIGDGPDKEKFFDFLSTNERKLVNVDVNLSDEQMKQVRDYPLENKKGLYVDLSYTDKEGYPAGAQLLIDLSGGENDLYLDERPSSQRLQSYLKIVGVQGPQQGIFSVSAVPVAIESIR
ncbi:MAG TPA: hypothetical protein VEQ40_09405, partial [Pyrinomonadaceae bacterium]|nr:hypothetical protein [Pyrinomonadaceae bacterium]